VELLSSPDGKARVLWRAEATAKGMRTVQLGHPDAGWRESMPLTGQLPDSELAVHAVTGRGNAAELRFRLADLNEAKVWSGRRLESRDRFHKSRDCP
jgi:lysophospholipase L1-like esterase